MAGKIHSLLRYLERYTKTDMVYLAKGSFWLSIGQVVSVITSFALSIALGYFLTQDTFGNYKFILSLAGIIGGLSLSGLGTIVTQAVARGADGTIHLAVRTQLLWGNIVAFVGLCFAAYYFVNGNMVVGTSLVIISICLPLTNSTGLYGAFLSGKKDFKRGTLYWILSQVLSTIVLIIVAAYIPHVIALIASYFIINLVCSIFLYRRTLAVYKPAKETADKEMVRQGHHLSAMAFIGIIANQLDKVLVFHYAGAAPLAIYAFANAIPEQVRGFFKNILNVGTPKLALLERPALRKSISDKVVRLTFIALLIVIAYYFAAPYIYALFFPRYLESVFYSQLYMVGLIFFPGIAIFSLYFQLTKETKILYKLTIIGNIATAVLSILLIPKYGALGAVIENSLSWFVMLLVNLFYFLRKRI